MIYNSAEKHSTATARAVHICKVCDNVFRSFYLLRKHKRNKHGSQIGSGVQTVDNTPLMRDVDDNSMRVELRMCKHSLVDNKMENGRHRVCTFATDTQKPKYLLEKLDVVINNLKRTAMLNKVFGFVLKNVEAGFVGIIMPTKISHSWSDPTLWLLRIFNKNQKSTE